MSAAAVWKGQIYRLDPHADSRTRLQIQMPPNSPSQLTSLRIDFCTKSNVLALAHTHSTAHVHRAVWHTCSKDKSRILFLQPRCPREWLRKNNSFLRLYTCASIIVFCSQHPVTRIYHNAAPQSRSILTARVRLFILQPCISDLPVQPFEDGGKTATPKRKHPSTVTAKRNVTTSAGIIACVAGLLAEQLGQIVLRCKFAASPPMPRSALILVANTPAAPRQ